MPTPKPIDEKSVLLTFLRGQREHVLGALDGLG